jgi:hypothetical protein
MRVISNIVHTTALAKPQEEITCIDGTPEDPRRLNLYVTGWIYLGTTLKTIINQEYVDAPCCIASMLLDKFVAIQK